MHHTDPEKKTRFSLFILGHFLRLWKTTLAKKVLSENAEMFPVGSKYYFSNINRICHPDYEPSMEDMLLTYFPTTGVSDLKGKQKKKKKSISS